MTAKYHMPQCYPLPYQEVILHFFIAVKNKKYLSTVMNYKPVWCTVEMPGQSE